MNASVEPAMRLDPYPQGADRVIRLSKIRKLYRTSDLETTALEEVSLEVDQGEFVAIMGPSGCGKSTLLNIIGLIDTPTSGAYHLDGAEVSGYSESRLTELRKRAIGFIFQSFNLIDDLTVHENVELPLLYQGMARAARRTRVREVLELVGLESRAKHKPAQLSGGQQQRVAVARAVVGDPKLIVADEPTGNLDTKNGEDVMDMLATLNEQGATIVMVTHSPSHAGRASRLINLLDGRIVPNLAAAI
jgi:putative ABC transport system ATP-binding protein